MKIVYTELLAKSNAGQEKVGPKIHLGQRVKKSEDNKYGWEDKITADQIDRTKPIVICLPGGGAVSTKASNGMCKSIEEMLGISGLSPENKPCQIYGVYYCGLQTGCGEEIYFDSKADGKPDMSAISERNKGTIEEIEEFARELVESVFKPLVQDENGKLHQFEEIKRGFRNIHFVSYCFGSVVQSAINQELRQYLQTTILDPKSIKILESQICVLQAAPIANETKTGQTTVNFVSLDDEATKERPIQAKAIAEYRDLKEKNIIGGVVKSSNDNPTVYVVKFTSVEDEEHFSEFYLHSLDKWPKGPYESKYEENVGGILPVCTSVCLRRAMKNAVSNLGANEYTPLKVGDLIKPCDKYMDWAKYHPQNIPKNLLDIYNNHFNYTTNNLIEVLEKDDNKDLIKILKEDDYRKTDLIKILKEDYYRSTDLIKILKKGDYTTTNLIETLEK